MGWALRDFFAGAKSYPLWLRLALVDIQQIYRRSLFGLAWVAMSFGIFVFVKVFIFGQFAPVGSGYFAGWVAIGFWVWIFISNSLTEGSNAFITSRSWILGTNLPLSTYIFLSVTRGVFKFVFSLPVIIVIMIMFDYQPKLEWLWVLPGLLALVVNAIWVQGLLATICSRFRDVAHLFTSIAQVMFFLTPILYLPEQLGSKAYLLDYNPATHYLTIIREPILSGTVPLLSWQVVGIITIVGWIVMFLTFKMMGRDVPFYV